MFASHLLLSLAALPAVPQPSYAVQEAAAESVEPAVGGARRALLVGVEAYPQEAGWPRLAGPRRDLEALEAVLVERAGFPREHVRHLIDEQATRAGILMAMDELVAATGPGDVALFYFSGHGSHVRDVDGDESDGWDESLVPFDALTAEGEPNDILDDDLQRFVARLNEKTEQVVVVLDSCSSGTATRGGEEGGAKRYLPPSARGLAGTRASRAAPAERRSGFYSGRTRGVTLSACCADESAFEQPGVDGGGGTQGLFTWALVMELRATQPGTNYVQLMERVRDRVHAVRPEQTPVVEGSQKGNVIFGATRARGFLLELESERWLLRAGATHGLQRGALLAVWSDADGVARTRLGSVRAMEILPTRSEAVWFEGAPEGTGPFRATVLDEGPEALRMGVALEGESAVGPEAARALRLAIAARPSLRVASAEEAELSVGLDPAADLPVWRVRAADGAPLPLAAAVGDASGEKDLVRRLAHLGRARRLAALLREGEGGGLAFHTRVVRVGADGRELGEVLPDESGELAVHVDERIAAELRNDSRLPIYAALLVISPDGWIWPAHTVAEHQPLAPGATTAVPYWEVDVTPGAEPFYAGSPDLYVWVVSTSFADFTELEQGSVVTLGTRGLAGTRAGGEDVVDAWASRTTRVRVLPRDG